jgi:hypothetical protein
MMVVNKEGRKYKLQANKGWTYVSLVDNRDFNRRWQCNIYVVDSPTCPSIYVLLTICHETLQRINSLTISMRTSKANQIRSHSLYKSAAKCRAKSSPTTGMFSVNSPLVLTNILR